MVWAQETPHIPWAGLSHPTLRNPKRIQYWQALLHTPGSGDLHFPRNPNPFSQLFWLLSWSEHYPAWDTPGLHWDKVMPHLMDLYNLHPQLKQLTEINNKYIRFGCLWGVFLFDFLLLFFGGFFWGWEGAFSVFSSEFLAWVNIKWEPLSDPEYGAGLERAILPFRIHPSPGFRPSHL